MPVAIAGAVAFLGSLFLPAAAGFALSLGVGAAILGVVAYQAKRVMGMKDRRGGERVASHQVAVRGTAEPRKIVYGEALISGPIWYQNAAGGAEFRSMYAAVTLTGHEVQSFEGVWLDDRYVPWADVDDLAGGGDGGVDADTNAHGYGPLTGGLHVLYLREHLGTSTQTTDTDLSAAFAGDITANDRERGCAYIVVRADKLDGADQVWQKGFPANVAVVVRGKKVYDPRLDSTFTGTWGTGVGAHRLNNPATWTWSRNPALCTADYLIDTDLGAKIDSARISYNSVAVAADVCDANVSIPGPSTEARYRCDGVLSCADTHRTNLKKLLSSFDGVLRENGNLLEILTGAQTVAMSLNESHLVGPLKFQKQPTGDERYNAVRGVYFDPTRRHKEGMYLSVRDTALQSGRDDGDEIFADLDLPMTNGEYNAQRLAIRAVNKAGYAGILVFPTGYNGLDLLSQDVIEVTYPPLSWVSKRFKVLVPRVVDLVGVEIIAQEDATAIYTDPSSGAYGTRTTAGTIDFPTVLRADTIGGGTLVQDPSFIKRAALWDGVTSSEKLAYYWRDLSSSGGTARILPSGGVVGGVLELVCPNSGAAAYAGSIARPSAIVATGEQLRYQIRVRKRNNPVLTAGVLAIDIGVGDGDGIVAVLATGGGSTVAGYAAINAWTVDQWQTFTGTVTVQNAVLSSPQYPYFTQDIVLSFCSHSLTLEVDFFNATRV